MRRVIAGRWYGPPAPASTSGATANLLRAIPFFWPGGNVAGIGCEVTTGAANSAVRLGVYADNGQNYPGDLLTETAALATTGTGAIEATIDVDLAPGLYWLAAVAQGGTPTLRAIGTYHFAEVGNSGANPGTNGRACYLQNGVTAELPAAFSETISTGFPGYLVSLKAG